MALSNVRWQGMKALEIMLDVLPGKIAGRKLSTAYKKSLLPVRDKMRNFLPKNRTGKLWFATDVDVYGNQQMQQMYAIVGPRRKRMVWNKQGWHAHIVEKGTKPHTIRASSGKMMPVFNKSGFTGKFAKEIQHKGSRAFKPFSKAIDSEWNQVSLRISDEVSGIMRDEIDNIFKQYGQVYTTRDI